LNHCVETETATKRIDRAVSIYWQIKLPIDAQ